MKRQPLRRRVDSLEVLRCRRILEIRRDEAMRSLDRLGDEARGLDSECPKDAADVCTTNLSKEALFQQREGQQRIVRMSEAALERILQGTFGVCAACGNGINPRRLDALPWTQYCLRCQEDFEQGEILKEQVDAVSRRVPLKKAG